MDLSSVTSSRGNASEVSSDSTSAMTVDFKSGSSWRSKRKFSISAWLRVFLLDFRDICCDKMGLLYYAIRLCNRLEFNERRRRREPLRKDIHDEKTKNTEKEILSGIICSDFFEQQQQQQHTQNSDVMRDEADTNVYTHCQQGDCLHLIKI